MSSGSSKKGGGNQLPPGTINQELGIQRQLLTQSQNAFNTGMKAWQPSLDYWSSLMKGGQAARTAVGPAADLISQATQANQNSIQQNLPRGGERNLAEAQAGIQGQNNISRLYAGIQPTAAQALMGLSSIPMGISPGFAASGSSLGNSFINMASQQNAQQSQSKTQGAAGVGQMAAMMMLK